MKTKQYTFLTDSGHGWLKVTKAELKKLGIADKVSGCSYERGGFAYLEEDCDAGLFIDALKANGVEAKFKESYTDGNSRVRYYDSYRHLNEVQEKELEDLKVRMRNYARWGTKGLNKIKNANLDTMYFWANAYGF